MTDTTNERTGPNGERKDGNVASEEARRDEQSGSKKDEGKLDDRLDEGLEETFPSSDPVSVKVTK